MTLTVFGVLAGLLIGPALALAHRLGRSAREASKWTPWSDSSGGELIREGVRRRVWQRDRGACVVCGNREDLRFEPIIAVGRGGSNTVRNFELRCARCQRLKDRPDENQRSGRSATGLSPTGDIGSRLEVRKLTPATRRRMKAPSGKRSRSDRV